MTKKWVKVVIQNHSYLKWKEREDTIHNDRIESIIPCRRQFLQDQLIFLFKYSRANLNIKRIVSKLQQTENKEKINF